MMSQGVRRSLPMGFWSKQHLRPLPRLTVYLNRITRLNASIENDSLAAIHHKSWKASHPSTFW